MCDFFEDDDFMDDDCTAKDAFIIGGAMGFDYEKGLRERKRRKRKRFRNDYGRSLLES